MAKLLLALALLCALSSSASAQPLNGPIYIPMRLALDGTFYVELSFGTSAHNRCLVDSGASTVAVTLDVFSSIIAHTKVIPFGTFSYVMADGSVRTGPKFAVDGVSFTAPDASGVLRTVSFDHVPVVVIPNGECLIGQALLQRFDTVAFNYSRGALEVWWR